MEKLTVSAQSTALNQSRLEVLRKREEHLQQLFDEAGKKVKALSDSDKYPEAMESLVLEVGAALQVVLTAGPSSPPRRGRPHRAPSEGQGSREEGFGRRRQEVQGHVWTYINRRVQGLAS